MNDAQPTTQRSPTSAVRPIEKPIRVSQRLRAYRVDGVTVLAYSLADARRIYGAP